MNTNRLPQRNEIPDKYKWHLTDLYSSAEDFEKDFNLIKMLISNISSYKDTITQSSDNLLNCLESYFEIDRKSQNIHVYAHMSNHQDTTDPKNQLLADRVDSLGVEISSACSFITPAILSIPEDTLKSFIDSNPKLAFYKKYLDRLLRNKPHILSEREEKLLAMSGEISGAPSAIFNNFDNADIKFPDVKDEDGNLVELTHGRYIKFMESRDRDVRKAAFKATYSTYGKFKNTLAATLGANVKSNIFYAKARNFSSARAASLFYDNVDEKVYDNLIDAVHKKLPVFYKYISLRKKILKLEKLHMYDVYNPIVDGVTSSYSFEDAVDIVTKALAPLGSEYISKLKKGFESGWIDVYENVGKRSGAYSWGSFDTHPYVLLNHNNTLDSVFTVAHEMGHAMHSLYSWSNQPYIYSGYKIFVAEVASTLNEALLTDYLLKTAKDKATKLYILNHFFNGIKGTLFRQTMFGEFEKIIHEKVEAGEALNADTLCSIYGDLNKLYYGPDVVSDDEISLEWARIPHFYTSFYVYKYATGYSAAAALSHRILTHQEGALEDYLNFLKSGGSAYPLDQLKAAGVDMTTTLPIESAIDVFDKYLDEFEELCK